MSLRKHGTGKVLLEEDDIAKTAATINEDWTPEDQAELEAEGDKE